MSRNKLIFHGSDELGPIQVFEDGITRSLHFGSRSRQSAMLLLDPTVLVLSYTRAILTALIYHPQPGNILILGHGGGSLAKYLLKHYPQSRVDVVELRPKVVNVSHEFFAVPERHPRLHLHIADALRYLQGDPGRQYDLILVDAFTEQGLAETVHHDTFIRSCHRHLSPNGVLCINIWTSHERAYHALLYQLRQLFPEPGIRQVPVRERGNSILMASRLPLELTAELESRALSLHEQLGLEFPIFIQDMYAPLSRKMGLS